MYHRNLLEDAGFSVEEAANGYEGLEKALQFRFELFLVDVNMPKMDGYQLVERLRANGETRATPVIMISTESEEQDRDRAYLVGANYYLTKPVRPEQLTATVSLLAGG
jgi:two-component system chemotaxis response regulator CheY